MFKSFKCLLAVLLVVTSIISCVFCVNAASTDALCVEVGSVTAEAGETVDVDVTVTSNPGVTAVKLVVTFDESVLTLVAAEDKGLFNEGIFSNNYASDYELVWLDALSTENNTATGVIATLTFKVNDDAALGATAITVYTVGANDILDADVNKIELNATAGGVTVAEASTVMVGDFDGNERVTANDAIYVLNHSLYSDEYPLNQKCDYDDDEAVTEKDAIYLLYHVLFGELYPIQ